MRTCTQCNKVSGDGATDCIHCGADLSEFSTTAMALKRLRKNPRVQTIRLIPHADCCPACRAAEGLWSKELVPDLPVQGCSHPHGCRCFYEPQLAEMYP